MIVGDRQIGYLRYFWNFWVSVEVCFECLLRGLEH